MVLRIKNPAERGVETHVKPENQYSKPSDKVASLLESEFS